MAILLNNTATPSIRALAGTTGRSIVAVVMKFVTMLKCRNRTISQCPDGDPLSKGTHPHTVDSCYSHNVFSEGLQTSEGPVDSVHAHWDGKGCVTGPTFHLLQNVTFGIKFVE